MLSCFSFFFYDPASTEIYTLSLHDALPISPPPVGPVPPPDGVVPPAVPPVGAPPPEGGATPAVVLRRVERSEEHTSELQSHSDLVCRLLLEKKKKKRRRININEKNQNITRI